MEKLIFGMPTLIEMRTLREDLNLCRELGLKFVELNMNFPEFQQGTLPCAGELRTLSKEYGVFFTLHLDENLNIADFNPLVREAYVSTARFALRLAAEAGMPIVNMHLHPGVYITLPDRKVYLYERDREHYLSCIRAFREMCREETRGTGVTMCVENTSGFRAHEREAVDTLLESPAFGLTWDIGHSAAVNEKDLPFLTEREGRLRHFHIHDGSAVPPRNHLALGDGEIDLSARLELAARHGCRCVLETKTAEALRRSAAWLRERGWMG